MKNTSLTLTQVSLQYLTNCYDSATTGVLVLSHQEPCRGQAKRKPSLNYCNNAAAALLGLVGSESEGKPSDVKFALLKFLEVSEPGLFHDIATHLKRIADADPAGELVIQITSRKYTQGKPSNALQNAPSGSDPSSPGFKSLIPKEERQQAARRWHKVVLEPVMLVSDASDDESVGARSTESPSASNRRLSKLWRIATCCGVSNQQNHAAWPAVVVTLRPFAHSLPKSCGSPGLRNYDSLEMLGLPVKPPACGSRGASVAGSSQVQHFGCVLSRPRLGDTERPYEQMVLSALTPIITAVTPDGRGVVYQNGLSVAYFGRRAQSPSPSGQQQEEAEVRPDAVQVFVEHDGLDAGRDVLAELFSLEPEKFERMMTEVCIEGRVWRGIVQVPASCYSSPKGDICCTLDHSIKFTCSGDKAGSFRRLQSERQEPGHLPSHGSGFGIVGGIGVTTLTQAHQTPQAFRAAPATDCSEVGQGAPGWNPLQTAVSACDRILQTTHDDMKRLSLNVEDALATSTWSLLTSGAPGAGTDHPRQAGSGSTITSARRNSLTPMCEASISLTVRHTAWPPKLQTAQASDAHAHPQPGLQVDPLELYCEPAPMQNKASSAAIAPPEAASPVLSVIAGEGSHAKSPSPRDPLGLQLRAPWVPSVSSHAPSSLASSARHKSDFLWPRATSITIAPDPADGQEGEDEHLRELLSGRANSMTMQHTRLWQHGVGVQSIASFGGRSVGPVRRCISRQELGISSNNQTRTTARVMAFASSLRITPPVVQQVLQQAVAGAASTAGWRTSMGILGSGAAEEIERNGRSGGGGVADNHILLPLPDATQECSNKSPASIADGPAAASSVRFLRPLSGHMAPCEITAATPSPASLGSVTTPGGSMGSGPNPMATSLTASGLLRTGSATHRLSRQDVPSAPGKEMASGQRSRTNPLLATDLLNRTFSTAGKMRRGLTVNSKSGLAVSTGGSNAAASALAALDDENEMPGSATSCKVADAAEPDLVPLPLSQQALQFQQPSVVVASGASPCWHEVAASRAVDPRTGQLIIVVAQTDVTAKVEAERHLALVTEAEHRLLEQIFPRHVLVCLTEEGGPLLQLAAKGTATLSGPSPSTAQGVTRDINRLATSHAAVSLLFADIQGFTPMCKHLEPRVVMTFLNDLFTRFDRQLDEFGVYKVETIGDCYFVAGGLVHEDEDGMAAVRARESHADPAHAEKVYMFARAMLSAASKVRLPTTGGPVRVRIGIHTGPVVSGLVGERMPRFCLFGDTVNTASRMESTGVPGCIHVSEATWRQLPKEGWTSTGGIEVKGKGLMNTYMWAPPDTESQALLANHIAESAAARSIAGRGSGTGNWSGGCLQAVLRQRQTILRRQPRLRRESIGDGGASRGSGSGTSGPAGNDGPTVKRMHTCSGSGSFPLAWFAGNSFAASAASATGVNVVAGARVDCAKAADLSAAQLEDFLFNR